MEKLSDHMHCKYVKNVTFVKITTKIGGYKYK